MMTCMDAEPSGATVEHYRTSKVPGQASQTYPQLLTAVLGKLHSSKANYEYVVNGVCNPYLQVKVRASPGCQPNAAGACCRISRTVSEW